jgi:hypothetical protein
MTLCTNCKAKIPSLRARKQAVNADLHKLGLTYHDGVPLYQINSILGLHDFDVVSSLGTWADEGIHEEIGEGLWLTASFYRMESGRWEVVAYVNG